MINELALQALYFGKFPARGDFIKSVGNNVLLQEVDLWLSNSFNDVEINDARKMRYEQIKALHFTKVGLRNEATVIGSIVPSKDTSGRLFPLLLAGVSHFSNAKGFIQHLPIESKYCWLSSLAVLRQVVTTERSQDALVLLKDVQLNFATNSNVDYYEFLRVTSIMRTEQLFEFTQEDYSFANNIIALGLLFQPVVAQGFANLKKLLRFRLPQQADNAVLMATFWLDMLSSFLREHEVELLCVMTEQENGWYMLVSFHGYEHKLLNSVISQNWHDESWINMNDSAWILDYIENDAGLSRLHHILADETQSLFEVRNLFKEIFAGE